MPPKRATRNTRAKVPKEPISLTDEQQQVKHPKIANKKKCVVNLFDSIN